MLITLGIIGVIAAMTIPALMTNMRHKIASARLKKFYSTMKQALLLSEEENGDLSSWNLDLPYSDFYDTYLIPYIKTEKGKTNKAGDTLFFQDGSSMTLVYRGTCLDFIYDTNGKTAPNKGGYDKFRFLFCSAGTQLWCGPMDFCFIAYRPYFSTRQQMLAKCKTSTSVQYCSGLLQIDHWEFLPDYPY